MYISFVLSRPYRLLSIARQTETYSIQNRTTVLAMPGVHNSWIGKLNSMEDKNPEHTKVNSVTNFKEMYKFL